jgi:hypothetical protein
MPLSAPWPPRRSCWVSGGVVASGRVGIGVDVLSLDATRHWLYVASESGTVSIYGLASPGLTRMAEGYLAPNTHVVAVDPASHRVYFPLQNVGGKPMLRVMEPGD